MLPRVFVFSPKFVYYTSRARTLSTVFYCQGEPSGKRPRRSFQPLRGKGYRKNNPFFRPRPSNPTNPFFFFFSLLNCHPGSTYIFANNLARLFLFFFFLNLPLESPLLRDRERERDKVIVKNFD